MRFRLILQREHGHLLPTNYQYLLMSWIYKVIAHADSDYAGFLHERGYGATTGRQFKLFCFSRLMFPRGTWQINGPVMRVDAREIPLEVSFVAEKGAESFIMGLFQDQRFGLVDREHRMDFSVKRLETCPVTVSGNTLTLQTNGPLLVSRPPREGERKNAQYLSPTDAEYEHYFTRNLVNKYLAALKEGLVNQPLQPSPVQFRQTGSPPRPKGITMKEGTDKVHKLKGYEFRFELTAPIPLLEFGLACGFGEKNSAGMGYCKVVEDNKAK